MFRDGKYEIGQRVRWASNFEEYGTVIEIGYAVIKVQWDDGVISTYSRTPEAAGSIAQLKFIKGSKPNAPRAFKTV